MPQFQTSNQSNPNNFDLAQWFYQLGGGQPPQPGSGGNRAGSGGMNDPSVIKLSPYQEGVVKALKKAGEAHVNEAIQMGVPSQHIEQQAGVAPNPMQILSSILGTQSAEAAQPSQAGGVPSTGNNPQRDLGNINIDMSQFRSNVTDGQQQPQSQNVLSQIIPKDNKQINQPNDFSNKGSGLFNLFHPTAQNDLLRTQADLNRQKLAGKVPIQPGEQAAQGLLKTQTAELQQKIDGAEPIQPKDIAQLNRETYSATIQAANDAWQRNNDEIKTMQEQYKNLTGIRNWVDVTAGKESGQMAALHKTIIEKMKQNQQHLKNLNTILTNPPKPEQSQSPFQVGQKYNGETIRNVKRIK